MTNSTGGDATGEVPTHRRNDGAESNETLRTATSFWDHLNELRKTLFKALAVLGVVFVAVFCFKDVLFDVLFYPRGGEAGGSGLLGGAGPLGDDGALPIISTQLTSQFTAHLKAAFWVSFVICMPYCLYLIFDFVKPGLYPKEKKTIRRVFVSAAILFFVGVAVAYFILFPFTYRFLMDYRVRADVLPFITLDSYLGTLMTLCLLMGLLFELPVVIALLAALGIVNKSILCRYRRHAYVGIVVLAAIITPTTDAFSLALASIPILLLYEVSVWAAALIEKRPASIT